MWDPVETAGPKASVVRGDGEITFSTIQGAQIIKHIQTNHYLNQGDTELLNRELFVSFLYFWNSMSDQTIPKGMFEW